MTTVLTEVQYITLAQIAYGDFAVSNIDNTIGKLLEDHDVRGEDKGAFQGVSGVEKYILLGITSQSSGFSGQVYRPPDESLYIDQLVFTFSGTNSIADGDIYGFLQDLDDNGFISTGIGVPSQFLDAYAFVKSTIEIKVGNPMTDAEIASYVQANNITFTGHSLGGGIAQYLTYRTGGAAVTFNAVGIGQITGLNIDPQNYASYNVKNYVSSDDIVGNFGSHLGEVQYLAGVLSNTNVDIDAVSKVIRITLAMLTNNFNTAQGAAMIAAVMATMNTETRAYLGSQLTFEAHGIHTLMTSGGQLVSTVFSSDIYPLIEAIQDRADNIADLINGYGAGIQHIANGMDDLDIAVTTIATGTASLVTGTGNAATGAVQDTKDGIDSIINTRSAQLYQALGYISNDANAITSEIESFISNIVSDSEALLMQTNEQLNQSLTQAISQYSAILSGVNIDALSADIAKRMLQGVPAHAATLMALAAMGGNLAVDLGETTVDAIADSVVIIADYFDQQRTIIETHLVDAINGIAPHVINIVGSTVDVTGILADGALDVAQLLGQEITEFGSDFIANLTAYGGTLIDGFLSAAEGIANIVEGLLAIGSTTLDVWLGSGAYQQLSSWWTDITGASGISDLNASITGTNGDDVLFGYSGDNVISGNDGHDVMYGGDGNDTIYGGVGNDTLRGEAGDDLLIGDSWDSHTWTTGHYTGDDILDGGAGNDMLYGGGGDDTYIFGRGYGQDTIHDYRLTTTYGSYSSGGFDTIKFLPNISSTDILVKRIDNALRFSIINTNDHITALDYFGYYNWGVIEQAIFSDGTVWTEATLKDKARYIYGSEQNDTLVGFSDQNDVMYGYDGDDTLNGLGGDDILRGGDGNDTLIGGAGADTLYGGDGDDMLYGSAPDHQESYFGPVAYNDILDGGAGNDHLEGGSGDDTYIFGRGYGHDTIYDAARDIVDVWHAGFDTLKFLPGVEPSDVAVHRRNQNDLEFKIIDTGETITVIDHFSYLNRNSIDQVVFDDNTVWDFATIQEKAYTIFGTEGDDTITGYYDQPNYIYAGGGNDVVFGSQYADTLSGGAGNDTLSGGAGNDTYIFGIGDGQDTISDYVDSGYQGHTSGGANDSIHFTAGVVPENVQMRRLGNNLEIQIIGTLDRLTVLDHFASPAYSIENIKFANDVTWGIVDISKNAKVTGTSGNDSLQSDDYGHVFEGGTGDDSLQGGTGNDTYIFNLGDGQDTIYEKNGADTIQFGEGISPSDITVRRVSSGGYYPTYHLELSISGTADKVTVYGHFSQLHNRVEYVQFVDNTVWDVDAIDAASRSMLGTNGDDSISAYDDQDFTLRGLAGDDTLYGNAGNDTLVGGTGNDSLQDGSGSDTYVFNVGDGQDTIFDSGGSFDKLVFGAGITPDDIIVTRSSAGSGYGKDLTLRIAGTNDMVTLQYYFNVGSWTPSDYYRVEQIQFADNTVWAFTDVIERARTQLGTAGDDVMYSYQDLDDIMYGGAGNDELYGDSSEDALYGEAGNDTLIGEEGNDTLVGGTGNDSLQGGSGSDTYVFNVGDGQDTIFDSGGSFDKLVFGAGITPDDIIVTRSSAGSGYGRDLKLRIAGTNDTVTLQYYFNMGNNWTPSNYYRVEQIQFADDTVWAFEDVIERARTQVGTAGDDFMYAHQDLDNIMYGGAGNDELYGGYTDDTLHGEADNDTLYGGEGNDTLIGGTGNDYLQGESGSDTYVFNVGDGQDTIFDSGGSFDIAKFDHNLLDMIFERSNNDLSVKINNSTDSVNVLNWYIGSSYKIEEFEVAEGYTISNSQIEQLIQAMATFSADNNGMTWSQSLANDQQAAASVISQYWTASTA